MAASLYRFVTQRDERVCPVCSPLDGRIYAAGATPKLPLHPNCRCQLVPLTEAEIEPGMLIAAGIRLQLANQAQLALERQLRDDRLRLLIGAAIVGAAGIAIAEEEARRRRHDR